MIETTMSSAIIISAIITYFLVLMGISYFTGKNSDNKTFFIANRQSSWILVAVGMIGASLSGVTFLSIPGKVGAAGANMSFSYMQMVLGYLVGYAVIAFVLMPMYYKYKLTTIYSFLEKRLGTRSYKVAAFYFLLSRVIGASFRLFLVASVLHTFVFAALGINFFFTVVATIALIWVYTFRGGIKTIVWTDTVQTVCMLLSVILTVYFLLDSMDLGWSSLYTTIASSEYSQVFFFENGWNDPNNFFKQFISGALIAVVMTGLDQDMMQKNLTCKSLEEAQKNVGLFSFILIFANLLFLALGALLYIYAASQQVDIPAKTDHLFPLIALTQLPIAVGLLFILGLIAAAYSSADSALAALTTCFCIDFLNFEKSDDTEEQKKKTRIRVHLGFSILLLFVIVLFNYTIDGAIINELFKIAGYTYGPILGLFAYAFVAKQKLNNTFVIPVCLIAPTLCYFLNMYSEQLFNGFTFGFLIVALNGLLTFLGLLVIPNTHEKSHRVG